MNNRHPQNAPPNAKKEPNTPSHPHGSSKDKEQPDGAKHSTNSASPTQGESGKKESPSALKSIYTPQVTNSPDEASRSWAASGSSAEEPGGEFGLRDRDVGPIAATYD